MLDSPSAPSPTSILPLFQPAEYAGHPSDWIVFVNSSRILLKPAGTFSGDQFFYDAGFQKAAHVYIHK